MPILLNENVSTQKSLAPGPTERDKIQIEIQT